MLTGREVQWCAGLGLRVIDSENAGGYSPLNFPPSGGLCWASGSQSEKGGGEVYAESRSRGARGAATDQLAKGEIPGTHDGETRDGRKSMRKVRTDR